MIQQENGNVIPSMAINQHSAYVPWLPATSIHLPCLVTSSWTPVIGTRVFDILVQENKKGVSWDISNL